MYINKNDTLTDADMTSAGVMLMQFWISGAKEEIIGKEIEFRKNPNKNIGDYPAYWKV